MNVLSVIQRRKHDRRKRMDDGATGQNAVKYNQRRDYWLWSSVVACRSALGGIGVVAGHVQ